MFIMWGIFNSKQKKKALGTKVSFKPLTKSKGKIIIEYFSSEELDRILELLEK